MSFRKSLIDDLAKNKESLRPKLSITSTLYFSADPLKARSLFVIAMFSKNGRIFSNICRFVSLAFFNLSMFLSVFLLMFLFSQYKKV